jgi:hypothetical protein
VLLHKKGGISFMMEISFKEAVSADLFSLGDMGPLTKEREQFSGKLPQFPYPHDNKFSHISRD